MVEVVKPAATTELELVGVGVGTEVTGQTVVETAMISVVRTVL
jgi:hypothetical protein